MENLICNPQEYFKLTPVERVDKILSLSTKETIELYYNIITKYKNYNYPLLEYCYLIGVTNEIYNSNGEHALLCYEAIKIHFKNKLIESIEF